MPTPLWILSDPEDELAASAITARLEAAGIQMFHVGEDGSETGAEEIHVLTNDYEEALIQLRPNREYFAENDAAVVPKNSRAYKPWVKAIKRNVAKASP
jgi:hypothetical protein